MTGKHADRWWQLAACADGDPDLFFLPVEQGPLVEAAKSVCRTCPVLRSCLAWAVRHPDQALHGVWGATTSAERRALARMAEQSPPPPAHLVTRR